MRSAPTFSYEQSLELAGTPEGRAEILRTIGTKDAYVTGGYSALLHGVSGLHVTRDP
jgi:hypothetical protein